MRYSMKEYPSVTAANPKLPVSQIASIIGQRWRELGEAEKQIYHKERSNDMAKYKSEMAKIESDPGSKDQLQQIKEEKSKKRFICSYKNALYSNHPCNLGKLIPTFMKPILYFS